MMFQTDLLTIGMRTSSLEIALAVISNGLRAFEIAVTGILEDLDIGDKGTEDFSLRFSYSR